MNWQEFSMTQKAVSCIVCNMEVPKQPRRYRIGWLGMHLLEKHWKGDSIFPENADKNHDILQYIGLLTLQLKEGER